MPIAASDAWDPPHGHLVPPSLRSLPLVSPAPPSASLSVLTCLPRFALSTIMTPTATIATPAHLDRVTFLPRRARAATVPSVSSRPDISISATAASMQSGIQKVE